MSRYLVVSFNGYRNHVQVDHEKGIGQLYSHRKVVCFQKSTIRYSLLKRDGSFITLDPDQPIKSCNILDGEVVRIIPIL
jgi:hypothetical protein